MIIFWLKWGTLKKGSLKNVEMVHQVCLLQWFSTFWYSPHFIGKKCGTSKCIMMPFKMSIWKYVGGLQRNQGWEQLQLSACSMNRNKQTHYLFSNLLKINRLTFHSNIFLSQLKLNKNHLRHLYCTFFPHLKVNNPTYSISV